MGRCSDDVFDGSDTLWALACAMHPTREKIPFTVFSLGIRLSTNRRGNAQATLWARTTDLRVLSFCGDFNECISFFFCIVWVYMFACLVSRVVAIRLCRSKVMGRPFLDAFRCSH